jgi:hypothetical protein
MKPGLSSAVGCIGKGWDQPSIRVSAGRINGAWRPIQRNPTTLILPTGLHDRLDSVQQAVIPRSLRAVAVPIMPRPSTLA